ncbi:hypothetical protein PHLCEN_2v158 [Hermanssonia centrifuga]|uniref:Uncharacterized protein n=1 Tax=Hermanssonia centrifuga TaxID=98765 RepID=A0A2R6S6T6_9APHY|nr:hypothetical protein PHLCEN_2v158 [Hermanssonia centrifuga]
MEAARRHDTVRAEIFGLIKVRQEERKKTEFKYEPGKSVDVEFIIYKPSDSSEDTDRARQGRMCNPTVTPRTLTLYNDSNFEEVLWFFSRRDGNSHNYISLRDNPHFYHNGKVDKFRGKPNSFQGKLEALKQPYPFRDSEKHIYRVYIDKKHRILFNIAGTHRIFGNIWKEEQEAGKKEGETIILKEFDGTLVTSTALEGEYQQVKEFTIKPSDESRISAHRLLWDEVLDEAATYTGSGLYQIEPIMTMPVPAPSEPEFPVPSVAVIPFLSPVTQLFIPADIPLESRGVDGSIAVTNDPPLRKGEGDISNQASNGVTQNPSLHSPAVEPTQARTSSPRKNSGDDIPQAARTAIGPSPENRKNRSSELPSRKPPSTASNSQPTTVRDTPAMPPVVSSASPSAQAAKTSTIPDVRGSSAARNGDLPSNVNTSRSPPANTGSTTPKPTVDAAVSQTPIAASSSPATQLSIPAYTPSENRGVDGSTTITNDPPSRKGEGDILNRTRNRVTQNPSLHSPAVGTTTPSPRKNSGDDTPQATRTAIGLSSENRSSALPSRKPPSTASHNQPATVPHTRAPAMPQVGSTASPPAQAAKTSTVPDVRGSSAARNSDLPSNGNASRSPPANTGTTTPKPNITPVSAPSPGHATTPQTTEAPSTGYFGRIRRWYHPITDALGLTKVSLYPSINFSLLLTADSRLVIHLVLSGAENYLNSSGLLCDGISITSQVVAIICAMIRFKNSKLQPSLAIASFHVPCKSSLGCPNSG